MFLILYFQAILAPENILQRIDRHVWLALPTFSFLYVDSKVYRYFCWFCGHLITFTNIFRGYLKFRYMLR